MANYFKLRLIFTMFDENTLCVQGGTDRRLILLNGEKEKTKKSKEREKAMQFPLFDKSGHYAVELLMDEMIRLGLSKRNEGSKIQ